MPPAKTYSVARFYGLTVARAERLIRKVIHAAAGRCDLCFETRRGLLIHLRPTGEIRGVICPRDYRRVHLSASARDHYLASAYLAENHPREPIEKLLEEVRSGR